MITHEISERAKAYLLLTGRFKSAKSGGTANANDANPLSVKELNTLTTSLRQDNTDADLADLISPDSDYLLRNLPIDMDDRVRRLLGRGMQMSMSIEKWQQRGIWILCREDEQYPRLFNERMKDEAPPIIYGCGDPQIFDEPGLAIVGSRNVDAESKEFARIAGRQAAGAGFSVISGGVRGVDQISMTSALDADGFAVGVLANNLSRAVVASENRMWIADEKLLLISQFNPDAGFMCWKAMARNKLIYALSRAGLVVATDHNKGGTWAGAKEQLKSKMWRYVDVYVRPMSAPSEGLVALKELGSKDWPDPEDAEGTETLFEKLLNGDEKEDSVSDSSVEETEHVGDLQGILEPTGSHDDEASPDDTPPPAERLREAIKPVLLEVLSEPQKDRQVAGELDIALGQTQTWLKHFVKDGSVIKLSSPTRYSDSSVEPPGLFRTSKECHMPKESHDDEVSHDDNPSPSDKLLEAIKPVLSEVLIIPKSSDDVAKELGVAIRQTLTWLNHFVEDGSVTKRSRPTRYVAADR